MTRGTRILVVDDNKDMAESMARQLRMLGHQVLVAHDGAEGIEAARADRPEVILLDIVLSALDGYQVAARLRREDYGRDALIIAVTDYGRDEDRLRARESGFDHHLVKPVDHPRLLAMMARPQGPA